MNIQTPMTINSLLDWVKSQATNTNNLLDSLYIYTEFSVSQKLELELDDICYLDSCPTVTENNDEIFSDFVLKNNLEIMSSGEIFVDVTRNALFQDSNITTIQLLKALKHYLQTDGFMHINQNNIYSKWVCAILVDVSLQGLDLLLDRVGRSELMEYKIFSSNLGTILYSEDDRCDVSTLSAMCAREYGFGLKILVSETTWTHMLYVNGDIASPKQCPLSGQEKKKNPKRRIAPIPQAIQAAFPHTDIDIIKNYICDEKNETELVSRDGRFYVQENDKYPIGDGRQGFDFIRYLGFAIAM